ncbi:MAG: hypothetical protein UHD05_01325 [Ruminococcus sp.]|nr:hypothetical protein [Ruminococcus sp.]
MKKNSKKRVLLSSVAMLMVATVSLGTATYAWFTSSTSATADKLSVKTVKSSELKLSNIATDWTDQLHYNVVGKVLKPASSADGENWYTATAASKSAGTAKVDTAEKLSSLDGYVFADQLNVSNAGKADVDNVKIKFTLGETQQAAGAGYLRLALVEVDKRGADAEITGSFKDGVYAKAEDTAQAISELTVSGGKVTAIVDEKVDAKAGTNVEFSVGKLVGVGSTTEGVNSKYYNLYVWFEGQDADCKDANAGNEMQEITFTVEGDTVITTA